MPNILLDLVNGKVFCHQCGDYVIPQYFKRAATKCVCSVCKIVIREGSKRRKYEEGWAWCTICSDFRNSWSEKLGWCSVCHTKLRMHSYTKKAKQERESKITRY